MKTFLKKDSKTNPKGWLCYQNKCLNAYFNPLPRLIFTSPLRISCMIFTVSAM
jgi:hypothetical protein